MDRELLSYDRKQRGKLEVIAVERKRRRADNCERRERKPEVR